jgi:heme/copper-type cytochrome/quinol oxidase subunit 2
VSVPARVAALTVTFLIVAGLGVFTALYYIGSATTQLTTVHYSASGGQVNLVLQEDPQNDSASRPDWVSYYTQDPTSKQWVHTTLFSVPANTKINVTIYGYDGCTPLRNNYFSGIQGVTGNAVTVQQFNDKNKPLGAPQAKSVINSWADCNVGHTFAIPALGIYVPVASPNANNSVNNLCVTSPCTPTSGGAYALETFSFMSPKTTGAYRWQCLIPCGGGFVHGNGGPMQTLGWMAGFMYVVAS